MLPVYPGDTRGPTSQTPSHSRITASTTARPASPEPGYHRDMPTRRSFILSGAAVGGGLLVAYGIGRLDDGDVREKLAAQGRPGIALNAWLKIDRVGRVYCAIHRAEMGQAVSTSLAMLLCEELDADWPRVHFEFAPVDRDYYNFGLLLDGQPLGDPEASWWRGAGTWAIREAFHAIGLSMTISSSSVIDGWESLRPAGAAARAMLLQAAAREWQVPIERLRTRSGRVIDLTSRQVLDYGELAEAASRERPPRTLRLKPRARWRLLGRNLPRLDTRAKITGQARFGIDVLQPDMLHAAIRHSPIAGSRVARFDAKEAEAMPGVRGVVAAGKPGAETAVAVVADTSWQAQQAAARLSIVPAAVATPLMNSASTGKHFLALLDAPDAQQAVLFRDDDTLGPAAAERLANAVTVTAEYQLPFLAHACMEPMNCSARFSGEALEIWAPTQAHSMVRDIGAAICELDTDRVQVHTTFLGGGFGRRAEMDFVEQAVSVARQFEGRTIKLCWSREQDFLHDAFRPAAAARISGSIDTDGELLSLDYRLATQSVVASYETRTPTPRSGEARSDRSVVTALDPPIYRWPKLRVAYVPVTSHVPAGFWRSVSHSWNTFFIESFIDELAVAAGLSPLALRLQALAGQPRHRAVLEAVAAALSPASASAGADARFRRGVGYAVAESHGTVVAHAIELHAAGTELAGISRVVCAIDCGPVIHSDGVVAQMESSIADGLSAALYGEMPIVDGMAQADNFDRYPRLRMAEMPAIEVILMDDSPRQRPAGVGEPGVPGVAPALLNALYAATGHRVRKLPLRPLADSSA